MPCATRTGRRPLSRRLLSFKRRSGRRSLRSSARTLSSGDVTNPRPRRRAISAHSASERFPWYRILRQRGNGASRAGQAGAECVFANEWRPEKAAAYHAYFGLARSSGCATWPTFPPPICPGAPVWCGLPFRPGSLPGGQRRGPGRQTQRNILAVSGSHGTTDRRPAQAWRRSARRRARHRLAWRPASPPSFEPRERRLSRGAHGDRRDAFPAAIAAPAFPRRGGRRRRFPRRVGLPVARPALALRATLESARARLSPMLASR